MEDNIINLRILEGLMKRLKVRWETAMNGQIAVDKWRGGGFHLVMNKNVKTPIPIRPTQNSGISLRMAYIFNAYVGRDISE